MKNLMIRFTRLGQLFGGFVLVSTLAGCAMTKSTDVKQSTIYTSYHAKFDASTNQVNYSATFNVGGPTGTYVILESPSVVLIDGRSMSKQTDIINQVTYIFGVATNINPEITSPHSFSYTNNDGTTYVNPVNFPTIVSTDLIPSEVFKISQGIAIHWSTADTAATDEIQATLQADSGNTYAIDRTQNTGSAMSGTLTFDSNHLKSFTPGNATIQICRSRSEPANQVPAAGGDLTADYCSGNVAVVLQP